MLFGSNCSEDTSLKIAAPFFKAKLATLDFLVSIEKIFAEYFLFISLNALFILLISTLSSTSMKSGLVDSPPMSIISAPSLIMFSI